MTEYPARDSVLIVRCVRVMLQPPVGFLFADGLAEVRGAGQQEPVAGGLRKGSCCNVHVWFLLAVPFFAGGRVDGVSLSGPEPPGPHRLQVGAEG